jgi:flagellar basal body-associated protein FliL
MKKIINLISENIAIVLTLSLFLVTLLLFKSCNKATSLKKEIEYEKQRTKQNLKAFSDSIEFYKTKTGIGYKKAIANMSIKELKKNNEDLYNKIKEEEGVVKTIIQTRIVYKTKEEINAPNYLEELGNNKYSLNFNYRDKTLSFKGNSLFSAIPYIDDSSKVNLTIIPESTQLLNLQLNIDLTTGIKEENGIDKIFIKSNSSNIQIKELYGADVSNYINDKYKLTPPKKRKNFSINFSMGYGLVFAKNNQVNHGPSIQLGFGYNIVNF